jgi:hypothetical protein
MGVAWMRGIRRARGFVSREATRWLLFARKEPHLGPQKARDTLYLDQTEGPALLAPFAQTLVALPADGDLTADVGTYSYPLAHSALLHARGNRRLATGADNGSLQPSQTPRAFIGQEEPSDVGLVHLNGRMYDPLLERLWLRCARCRSVDVVGCDF